MIYAQQEKKAIKALTVYNQGHLKETVKLGGILAKIFFRDSLDEYNKLRAYYKTHPFTRFCDSPSLKTFGVTKRSLLTYIRVYFYWDLYPTKKRELVPLGIHSLLVRVQDPKERRVLFNRAWKEKMSFREMEALVKDITGTKNPVTDQIRVLEETLKKSNVLLDEIIKSQPQKKKLQKTHREIEKLGAKILSYREGKQ